MEIQIKDNKIYKIGIEIQHIRYQQQAYNNNHEK